MAKLGKTPVDWDDNRKCRSLLFPFLELSAIFSVERVNGGNMECLFSCQKILLIMDIEFEALALTSQSDSSNVNEWWGLSSTLNKRKR